MSRGALLSTVVAAAIFGAVLALAPGDQRRVSIDLWLIGVATWAGIGLARRSLVAAPTATSRFRPLLHLVRQPAAGSTPIPRGVVTLEGSLLAGIDNPRSFHHRVRPRLRSVVAHQLRLGHGIDLDAEPGRAAAILGSSAWLIEDPPDGGDDRAPTPDDIHRLLDRVGADDGSTNGPR